MNEERWKCLTCGEEVPEQFDACWNCETPRGPIQDRTAEEKLSELVRSQRIQSRTLRELKSKVGCLYIYMWLGIVVGVISAWVFFANL